MPGRKPFVQVPPPSADRAQPMLEDPPSKKRPTWKAETIVDPAAKVSGSTSVACWLVVFVYGSELSLVSVGTPVVNFSVLFTPFGPRQTKSLQESSLPHTWYSYCARWASPLASWYQGASSTCGMPLTVAPFVHALAPTRRQRMNAEQLWSHEPLALRRAVYEPSVCCATLLAPVVRPEHATRRSAAASAGSTRRRGRAGITRTRSLYLER